MSVSQALGDAAPWGTLRGKLVAGIFCLAAALFTLMPRLGRGESRAPVPLLCL